MLCYVYEYLGTTKVYICLSLCTGLHQHCYKCLYIVIVGIIEITKISQRIMELQSFVVCMLVHNDQGSSCQEPYLSVWKSISSLVRNHAIVMLECLGDVKIPSL